MKTMKPIYLNSQAGIDLYSYLKNVLAFPDNCLEVTIKLKHNDMIQVDCLYYPRGPNCEPVSETFSVFPSQQS
jgi:hypothetical protein